MAQPVIIKAGGSASSAHDADFPEAHHIVSKSVCKRCGVPVWDTRNGVKVTRHRHEEITAAYRPLAWWELSPERQEALREFAAEHGLTEWVRRHLEGFE